MIMERLGIVPAQLLILLAHSVLFFLLGAAVGDDVVGPQWVTIIVHAVALLVISIVRFGRSGRSGEGPQYLLAFFLVLLIGHGLCFFNGLLNLNMH